MSTPGSFIMVNIIVQDLNYYINICTNDRLV